MFLYCITPYKNLKSNFIKVGICDDIVLLKNRYRTYYGNNCRYYYVKINDKNDENNIHIKLKILGLHLENELFLLNDEYDFYFYVQILKEFEIYDFKENDLIRTDKNINKEDIYILKRNNMLNFVIEMYINIMILKKKTINNISIYYDKKHEVDRLWKCYLHFCKNNIKYYNTKSVLKKNIQVMNYYDNPIIYKNYKIEFKTNEIIITNINIKNKYMRCKNKIKLLLLYKYIKFKREKYFYDIGDEINLLLNIDVCIFYDKKIINKKKYIENSYILQLFEDINDNYNYIFNELNRNKTEYWYIILYKWKKLMNSTIHDFSDIPQEYIKLY